MGLELGSVGDAGERGAGPQGEGLAQPPAGQARIARLHGPVPGAGQPLERPEVAAATAGAQPVAAGRRGQHLLGRPFTARRLRGRADDRAQPTDVVLQRVVGAVRQALGPEFVGEGVRRYGAVGRRHEGASTCLVGASAE